jgi:hypothetical protein
VRVAFALAVVCSVVAGTGCSPAEDGTQTFAREAVQTSLARDSDYDADEVHCTRNPRPWFVERPATVVICAARRARGGCDWFRVDLVPDAGRVTTKVTLDTRNAGCVLPS